MLKLSLRPIPKLNEIRDLLALGPLIEPLEREGEADHLDLTSKKYSYRFFRDCELLPFDTKSQKFELLNAWYLSEASLLAYANASIKPDTAASSDAAARFVVAQISAPLRRCFQAQWRRSGRPANTELAIHAIVRASPVPGLPAVQCYVVDDGKLGVVAFRGTVPSSLPNWLTDCQISLVNPDGAAEDVLVHEGFWAASKALMEDTGALPGLETYLAERRARAPGLEFWFTGHSFGGALATLTGYRLRPERIYSFGSPRVGNIHFANAFSDLGLSHYRVVHRHDCVPFVPIPMPLFQYEHVGDLKYIEWTPEEARASSAYAIVAPEPPPPERLSNHDAGIWERIREAASHAKLGLLSEWIDQMSDHSLVYYSNTLWNEFVKAAAARALPRVST